MKPPKEYAKELVEKFTIDSVQSHYAIECALIAVDEILNFSQELGKQLYQQIGTDSYTSRCRNSDLAGYYREVKTEIINLK